MRRLDAENRWAIAETLALHGHFSTGASWAGLKRSSPRVVYDLRAAGVETLEGIEAVRNGMLKLGAGNPFAHHVTNAVMASEEDDLVTARSKGLVIMAAGTIGSVTHLDTLRRFKDGRRISRPQRTSMNGADIAGEAGGQS